MVVILAFVLHLHILLKELLLVLLRGPLALLNMLLKMVGNNQGFTMERAFQRDLEGGGFCKLPFEGAFIGAAMGSFVPSLGAAFAELGATAQAFDGGYEEIHADMAEICLLVDGVVGGNQLVKLEFLVHVIDYSG